MTTFNPACVAREMMAGANIAQTGAAGEALIAIAAGKAAKEGADQAQVLALVKELIPCVNLLVTADTGISSQMHAIDDVRSRDDEDFL